MKRNIGFSRRIGLWKNNFRKEYFTPYRNTKRKNYLPRKNISTLSSRQMRSLRKDLQIIFQDPYASLNPLYGRRSHYGAHEIAQNRQERPRTKRKVMELLQRRLEENIFTITHTNFREGNDNASVLHVPWHYNPKLLFAMNPSQH